MSDHQAIWNLYLMVGFLCVGVLGEAVILWWMTNKLEKLMNGK